MVVFFITCFFYIGNCQWSAILFVEVSNKKICQNGCSQSMFKRNWIIKLNLKMCLNYLIIGY